MLQVSQRPERPGGTVPGAGRLAVLLHRVPAGAGLRLLPGTGLDRRDRAGVGLRCAGTPLQATGGQKAVSDQRLSLMVSAGLAAVLAGAVASLALRAAARLMVLLLT